MCSSDLRLARCLAGPRAGFWAAALLLTMPTWYGHMFNNPKDVPFAVFFVWSIYYMVRLLPELPHPRLGLCLKLGLMIGLALGVRVGALMLFGFLGLLGLTFVAARYWCTKDRAEAGRNVLAGLVFVMLPVLLVAYAVMLVFWPWAQAAPLTNPLAAMAHFQNLPFQIQVKFFGEYFVSSDPPWYYLPVELAFRLPEIVLPLALFACVAGGLALHRRRAPAPLQTMLGYGLLGLAVLFPLVYVIVTHANLFDGMRHFTFLLPMIAIVAGIGMDRLLEFASYEKVYGLACLLIAGFFAYHLTVMVRLHPDQYVYYNHYAGGIKSAAKRFELDYWANSFAEATNALDRELKAE